MKGFSFGIAALLVASFALFALVALGPLGCGARSELVAPGGAGATGYGENGGFSEDCKEITYIYLVTSQKELFRFDPRDASFTRVRNLDCPDTGRTSPTSMAVRRDGTAYILFGDGRLFEVDTRDGTCKALPFAPNQQGFSRFGMGYATNESGPEETLFVAESTYTTPSKGLGTIDTDSFTLSFVGPLKPNIGNAVELTGTGDGRLFALGIGAEQKGARLAEVDPQSGDLKSENPLPLGTRDSSFAFSFWDDGFYIFLAERDGITKVSRYRPLDGSLSTVASLSSTVVGAGVSTCAPKG